MTDKIIITIIKNDNGVKFEDHIDIFPVEDSSLDKDILWHYFQILNERIETEKENYLKGNS